MQFLLVLCLVAGAFAAHDCPANSHYSDCGTACPLTCENYQNPPKVCVLSCVSGCHCDEGYVKTSDGHCVKPQNCHAVCGKNKEYNECGTACPLTCDNYQDPPKICNLMCIIGCQCKKGYVRTGDGHCVLPENCPSKAAKNLPLACQQKKEVGLCKEYVPRYFYNQETGECEEFIFGGCKGNSNNFNTLNDCESVCKY